MLVPANLVIGGLESEFKKLGAFLADRGGEGSSVQAISHGLNLLKVRQAGGADAVRAQYARLSGALDEIEGLGLADLPFEFAELRARASASREGVDLDALEIEWRDLVAAFETLVLRLNDRPIDAESRRRLIDLTAAWETGDLSGQTTGGATSVASTDAPVLDRALLETYLQRRFSEPTLSVTAFQPLPGGFGKQTMVFSVSGVALNGDFVMRRDQDLAAILENDCHFVAREYPLVKAMHKLGFPSPDALWLEQDHSVIPGGDFIVMTRSPGSAAGSAFGPTQPVPDNLADSLAEIAAKLHGFAPQVELGDIAPFIRCDLWDLSRAETVRRYIREWYDYYLREVHTPSPALVALYGWLFENLPDRSGAPSLIHGDIGFHNFLFHNGELSAVLDWEFAHVGDPAEELGYIAMTLGAALDWDRFMARYVACGGEPVDAAAIHFFKVWSQVRNASAANIFASKFSSGQATDLNLVFLTYVYVPMFLESGRKLIEAGPST